MVPGVTFGCFRFMVCVVIVFCLRCLIDYRRVQVFVFLEIVRRETKKVRSGIRIWNTWRARFRIKRFCFVLTATTVSRMEKNRAVITQNEDTRTPSDGRLMHTFCFLLCATFRVLYTPEVNIFGETKHVECFR